MSHLPYIFDYGNQNQTTVRYAITIAQNGLLETIDTSNLEYYPNLDRPNMPNNKRFEVCLDVQDFLPEDIRVKTLKGFVVVDGKHKEKRDEHGWVSRQFQRRCPLPKGYKTEGLLSQYSSEGTLAITAALVKNNDECDVPVKKTEDNDHGNKNEENENRDGGDSNESNKKGESNKNGDNANEMPNPEPGYDVQVIEVEVDVGGMGTVHGFQSCGVEDFLRDFKLDEAQD